MALTKSAVVTALQLTILFRSKWSFGGFGCIKRCDGDVESFGDDDAQGKEWLVQRG